jgi:hypothetical protein
MLNGRKYGHNWAWLQMSMALKRAGDEDYMYMGGSGIDCVTFGLG